MNRTLYISLFTIGILIVLLVLSFVLLQIRKNADQATDQNQSVVNKEADKKAPFIEITIENESITPESVSIEKDTLIHFINKTDHSLSIKSIGKNTIPIADIPSNQTGISLFLPNSGVYSYEVDTIKGKVIVK